MSGGDGRGRPTAGDGDTPVTPARRTSKRAAAKPPVTGPERIPRRSQGFYRDPTAPAEKYRSVTTILEQGVPKDGLPYWAAQTVAASAIQNLPYLVTASRQPGSRTEAQQWLSKAATRQKDERADIGTAVHRLVEAHVLGQPVPDDLLADDDMAPYLEQFLRCVDDWQVTFEASEMVVANPQLRYAGTLDYLLVSAKVTSALTAAGVLDPTADPALPYMGDTKTGGEICRGDSTCTRVRPSVFKAGCPGGMHSIKGVYPDAGLQMSAYKHAQVCWLRDGSKEPMPATHPVGLVLHLRPDAYLLTPARCDDDVFEVFQHAQRVAEWTADLSKAVLADPLSPATTSLKASA